MVNIPGGRFRKFFINSGKKLKMGRLSYYNMIKYIFGTSGTEFRGITHTAKNIYYNMEVRKEHGNKVRLPVYRRKRNDA